MLALLCFVMTILIYIFAKRLYRLAPSVLLMPLLTVPIVVIVIVLVFHIPITSYAAGTRWISEMIGPGTVALAVPLYKNFGILKKHAITIGVSVGSGAIVLSSSTISVLFTVTGINEFGDLAEGQRFPQTELSFIPVLSPLV